MAVILFGLSDTWSANHEINFSFIAALVLVFPTIGYQNNNLFHEEKKIISRHLIANFKLATEYYFVIKKLNEIILDRA